MMSDVDNGGGYVTMGGIRKISVSSSQFCCKPQTALKNSLRKYNVEAMCLYRSRLASDF